MHVGLRCWHQMQEGCTVNHYVDGAEHEIYYIQTVCNKVEVMVNSCVHHHTVVLTLTLISGFSSTIFLTVSIVSPVE